MEKEYLQHTVKSGERWDMIAHQYYGTVNEMPRLIRENTHLPITPVLPEGATVLIPILDAPTLVATQDLPPWKR